MQIRAWHLPLIVVAIVVPIVAAFYVGGAGLGAAAGALSAVAIAVFAINQKPVEQVEVAPLRSLKRHVLVVISVPLADATPVEEILSEGGAAEGPDVRVLAPASISFLDRWASDVRTARAAAQERLVLSVASLAKAGVDSTARVGDEDLVQATEDELRSFPATEVVFVTGPPESDEAGNRAVANLRARLALPLRHVVAADQPPGEPLRGP